MRIFPTEAGRSLTARLVGVAELADPAVAGPAVGDDPSARLDGVGDEAVQRRRGSVRHDLHPAAAVPTRFGDLNGPLPPGLSCPWRVRRPSPAPPRRCRSRPPPPCRSTGPVPGA